MELVTFPENQRPQANIFASDYEVTALSEDTIKLVYTRKDKVEEGLPIDGRITFKDGDSYPFKGFTVAIEGNIVTIECTTGVPGVKILKEKQKLQSKW